jgi:antitoxin MazE
VRTSLHRIGNSQGVIIPKPLLAQLGLVGEVDLSVEHDAIVLRKVRPAVRAGWADDSKAIAAADDDRLVWPEFGNADDGDLAW